jgi:hypothetical protein
MCRGMAEQPLPPDAPDEDLPQDPGIPGGPPAEEPERDGTLERPRSPDDPRGIDAPGSPHDPPPQH